MHKATCHCGWTVEKETPGKAAMALAAHQRFGHKSKRKRKSSKPNEAPSPEPGGVSSADYCPHCGFSLALLNRAMRLVTRYSQK